ncbi:hypothetical protein B0H65DRAFT_238572 [Neurospora tetraspora]|uniref:Uncharacterized protein n=1 Tax=Neurospora tetraspora TaxID=94610 RepID=A0AAE0MRH7_9PEZI|nr:hypothetical protein B0H65DRAFT_238572 [Neurospora tetraspora]
MVRVQGAGSVVPERCCSLHGSGNGECGSWSSFFHLSPIHPLAVSFVHINSGIDSFLELSVVCSLSCSLYFVCLWEMGKFLLPDTAPCHLDVPARAWLGPWDLAFPSTAGGRGRASLQGACLLVCLGCMAISVVVDWGVGYGHPTGLEFLPILTDYLACIS